MLYYILDVVFCKITETSYLGSAMGKYLLENGVNIIGLTSGKDTKFHHTEKLDKGEVFLAQFTDVTTAIKINGAAEIYTKHGKLMSDAR